MAEQNKCSQERFFSLWGSILNIGANIILLVLTGIVFGTALGLHRYWLQKFDIFFLFWQIILILLSVLIMIFIKIIWFSVCETLEENMSVKEKFLYTVILLLVFAGLQLANLYCGSIVRIILLVIWAIIVLLSFTLATINVIKDMREL